MITTEDIIGWKRLMRVLLPLLAPSLTAAASAVLDPSSWRTAIAGAITGTLATLIAWSTSPPNGSGTPKSSAPTPVPPPSSPGPPTTDLRKAAFMARPPRWPIVGLLGAVMLSTLLAGPVHAQTRTTSIAYPGMPWVGDVAECMHGLQFVLIANPPLYVCSGWQTDGRDPKLAPGHVATSTKSSSLKLAFGPSAIASFAGLRLSGDPRGVPLGVGAGVHLDFSVFGADFRAGAYGATVLQLGDGSVFNLALIAVLSLRQALPIPIGLGLGWSAFSAGGADPGLHALDKQHLMLVGSFGLPIFGAGS